MTEIEKQYFNTGATSRMVDRAKGTLANDRLYGRGLPYIKLGGKILYDIEDIRKYLQVRKIRHED